MPKRVRLSRESLAHLIQTLRTSETRLVERALGYAAEHGYTPYTSTLFEPWRIAIEGLTNSLAGLSSRHSEPVDIDAKGVADEDLAAFGVSEARLHRARGITLSMFLGFLKWFRRAYLDIIEDSLEIEEGKSAATAYVVRAFDAIEIAVASEWVRVPDSVVLNQMQKANRELTNEKNKYLTVFESLGSAVILFDESLNIDNANAAAHLLFTGKAQPGRAYYSTTDLASSVPWLFDEVSAFWQSHSAERIIEQAVSDKNQPATIEVRFKRMLDVSGKFTGVVALFDDITHQKLSFDALEYAATHDKVTDLLNRGALEAELANAIADASEGERSAYLMADLDRFKSVNDTFGHAGGDHILKEIGELLSRNLRTRDVLARLGGDEFGIILKRSTLDSAKNTADRIRLAIEKHGFLHENDEIRMTISIGITMVRAHADVKTVMKAADRALYKAKTGGRNRVEVDSD